MNLHHTLLAALCSVGLSAQAQGITFTRNKVLLEKYTGINCGWCPSGDRAVEGYLNRHPEHRGVMVEMRHNAYTTPDRLTVPLHKSLDAVWRPNGYPKYYMDRCSTAGRRSTKAGDYAIDWDEFESGAFDPVASRLAMPTHVSISLEGSKYDRATRELTIYAHGDVTAELSNLCINVFIVQDIDGYENTSRASMTTDFNGDALNVFDGQYKVAYTTTLPERYGNCATVPADMKVIAFVSSRFDTDAQGNNDFTWSEVHNAECVSITTLPTTAVIPERCAPPTVTIEGGKVVFECSEAGATFAYRIEPVETQTTSTTVSSTGEESPAFIIKASAGTASTFPSDEVCQRFTLADILSVNDPVGVQMVNNQSANSQCYSLSGQRVSSTSGTRLTIPGIYIIGGRKVVRQ